ncbi:type II toxin-antitoxin system RelE/ParE family toxin [Bartonella tribocorum]|uniref:Plasmid stabilization protein ParE n=1 Tax=Bartonella tribocorum TaxID=85701 RepID=A0A2M6UQK6_9HYPH|nr:type II toxin-antitoxin system RelE/ParE family toxin [Bartonella tribocorum]PIT68463.1 plasmid stabilization protein ParE [Bartonella tribocorum]
MLPIIWLACARDDLNKILTYIAYESPPAARRMKKLLEDSVLPLAEHPYLYRQSEKVPGLREVLAHPNYLILCRVTKTQIEITSVVHARRKFPIST